MGSAIVHSAGELLCTIGMNRCVPASSIQAGPVADSPNWVEFGHVEVVPDPSDHGMLLDTDDTTKTWSVKWSGVIASRLTGCGWEISGQARNATNQPGVPGGFGIGLGSLDSSGVLSGLAAQFDYGFSGYRAVSYPSDDTLQQRSASLDQGWHTFDESVSSAGRVRLTVDNSVVLDVQGFPVCGAPVIRVWAGAVFFENLSVKPVN
jgi:hypothetical protein